MREMTREQVAQLIRRRVIEAGSLRGYCARQGVHISTLSDMLGGQWATPGRDRPVVVGLHGVFPNRPNRGSPCLKV